MWNVKERVGLPVWEGDLAVDTLHKNPGDKITKAEMEAAKQTPDDIRALTQSGAIEEA
jgi:hypothetical protein